MKRTILSLSVITVVFVVIVGSIVSSNEKRRSAEIRSSLISKENDSIAKLNFSLKAQNDSIILLYLRVERDAIELKHKNDSIEEMKNAIRKEAEAIRLRDAQILVKNLELEEKDDSLRINLLLNEKRVKQLEERIKELESTKNSYAIPQFGF